MVDVDLQSINYAGDPTNWQRVENVQTLQTNDIVRVADEYTGGDGQPGELYRYMGAAGEVDLGLQNYATGPWERVTASATSAPAPLAVNAFITDSDVDATGYIDINAMSSAVIDATVSTISVVYCRIC